MGIELTVTMTRPGFRVKKRALPSKVGKNQQITKEEVIDFMKKNFDVKIQEEIDEDEE